MPSKSKKRRQNLLAQQEIQSDSSSNRSSPMTMSISNDSPNTGMDKTESDNKSNGMVTEPKTAVDPNILKALTRTKPSGLSVNGLTAATHVYGEDEEEDDREENNEEEEVDEEEEEDEYDNDLDPILSKTTIQRLLSDTRNVVSYDVPDAPNLRPRSALTHPTLPMSRDQYIVKQNKIFEELTSHQSWRQKRESELDNESNDKLLMKMLEIFIAGQDEAVYNEFLEQKYLLDIVEDAAESAARYVLTNQSSNMKLRSLVINYGKMKAQIGKLQSDFLEMSSARSTVERQREHLQSALTDEFTKRIRLEHICKGMQLRINELESELKEVVENIELGVGFPSTRHALKHVKDQLIKIEEVIKSDPAYALQTMKVIGDNFRAIQDKELEQQRESLLGPLETLKAEQQAVKAEHQDLRVEQQNLRDEITTCKKSNDILQERLKRQKEERDILLNRIAELEKDMNGKNKIMANTNESTPPPLSTSGQNSSGVQELLDMFLKSTNPTANSNLDPSSRPEKMKQVMRQFFEQYAAREKYYKSAIRDKDLQIQIYLTRAKQERAAAETERKRAQVLKDQVAASSVAYAKIHSKLDSYTEKFGDLEAIIKTSNSVIEKSTSRMDGLENSMSGVKLEHTRVMDILSKVEENVENSIIIAEERDSLKAKVNTLENLCRTLAATKTKIQNDLAIQTALVREMRSQSIGVNGHYERDNADKDEDEEYDYEEYYDEDDANNADDDDNNNIHDNHNHNHHSDSDINNSYDSDDQDYNELIYNHLHNDFPNEAARKAAEHRQLLILMHKILQWEDIPPKNLLKGRSAVELFGFNTLEDLKSFVNSPAGTSGNCGDDCPLHGKSSPFKDTWEQIAVELRNADSEEDITTSSPAAANVNANANTSTTTKHDSHSDSIKKKNKPFFGPDRPPDMQKLTTNGSTTPTI